MQNINKAVFGKLKKGNLQNIDIEELIQKIRQQNRTTLAQAITLVESSLEVHKALAEQLIERILPYSGNSIRIGITGTPGVGKSTFIDAFGTSLTQMGKRVAVLAIDPSSSITKGSILGDKTRMSNLSNDENAFIRPSPSGNSLGGVARKTRETSFLCEAAGFDVILVETVGVGQSEVAVYNLTDFFLLLLQPGSGDELQGIKRGIMEIADLVVVNKADGDQANIAKLSKRAYQNALHFFPNKENNWVPSVLLASSVQKTGLNDIWENINTYVSTMKASENWKSKREQQSVYWWTESLQYELWKKFVSNPEVQGVWQQLEAKVREQTINPFKATSILLEKL